MISWQVWDIERWPERETERESRYRVPKCDVIKIAFQHFHDFFLHISVEHDEKP